MDTPCREKPNIKFVIEYPNRQIEKPLVDFYDSQDDMLNQYNSSIAIEEFDSVYISFEDKDETARLYLEGLELIPEKFVSLDENGDPYLMPNKEKCPLYLYDSEFYAVRVGKYKLCVKYTNREYFALIEVIPKHLTVNEWELIKNDLESELRGLAQDLIRRNIGLGEYAMSSVPVEKLYKFFVIKKHAESIIGALIDLKDKPNYKIVKLYNKVERSKSIEVDMVTIKDYLVKGAEKDKYLAPHREMSYDLQENRWLKKIIELYECELRDFQNILCASEKMILDEIDSLQNYLNQKSTRAEINAKSLLLKQLESYNMISEKTLKISNIIKTQPWYLELSPMKDGTIPHILVMDTRYSTMYKLYQELNNDEYKIKFDSEYSYAWKLTNKLYEMWCFIKIARMLAGPIIEFKAKGWIFDHNEEQLIIPMLKTGTCIQFTKDNCLLKLYYDTTIPRRMADTNLKDNPIYTVEVHNRPDARLDIYLDNKFMRSIIFEFKYRTIRNFWNRSNNTTSYSQIISYRHNTISAYTQGLPASIAREMRAVSEVWTFHPTGEAEGVDQKIEKIDEGIKIIRLKPNEDDSKIVTELNNSINNVILEK
jgi:hypothetical protein